MRIANPLLEPPAHRYKEAAIASAVVILNGFPQLTGFAARRGEHSCLALVVFMTFSHWVLFVPTNNLDQRLNRH